MLTAQDTPVTPPSKFKLIVSDAPIASNALLDFIDANAKDANAKDGNAKDSYDFEDLITSDNRGLVATTIRNTGQAPLSVNATLTMQQDILDRREQRVNLPFQRLVPHEQGALKPAKPDERVNIEAGNTATLYFRLQNRDLLRENDALHPAPGIYNAFLVVTAPDESKQEATLKIHVPSAYRTLPKTYWESITAWFEQWPERLSQRSSFGRKLPLDAALWVVLLVIFGYLLRWLVLYWRRSQVGTVEIKTLTDSTEAASTDGLKAKLNEMLRNLKLAPRAPQPFASINTEVGTLITASGISPTGAIDAIKSILQFLLAMLSPPIGHNVSITLRTAGADTEAIVEITDARTGQMEATRSVSADSPEAAVRKVAYRIYRHAINQKYVLRRRPKWERFSTPEGFEHYQQGKDAKDSEAIRKYKEAAALELNNALVRQSLASALVDSKCFIEGLIVYLNVVMRWPMLLEPRYRLAATLSFGVELCKDLSQRPEHREALKSSLQDFIERDGSTRGQSCALQEPSRENFLMLAHRQWQYLHDELSWSRRVRQWLETFKFFGDLPPDMRTYLGKLGRIWPGGLERRRFQRVVETANCCSEIQQKPDTATAKCVLARMEDMLSPGLFSWREMRWWGMTWPAHYNAACAYSIALCINPDPLDKKHWEKTDPLDKKHWEKRGVDELDHVIRDPGSATVWESWLFDDPDLKGLRDCEEFKQWKERLSVDREESVPPSAQQPPADSIAQGWELLAAGASLRWQRWETRQQTLLKWTRLDAGHFREIREWYQHEADLWTAVVELATHHGDADHHDTFWQELMRDMEKVGQRPPLSVNADTTKLRTYQRRWHQLAMLANRRQRRWDSAEDGIRRAIADPPHGPTGQQISNYIEAAIEAWRALESWARNPLEKPVGSKN